MIFLVYFVQEQTLSLVLAITLGSLEAESCFWNQFEFVDTFLKIILAADVTHLLKEKIFRDKNFTI